MVSTKCCEVGFEIKLFSHDGTQKQEKSDVERRDGGEEPPSNMVRNPNVSHFERNTFHLVLKLLWEFFGLVRFFLNLRFSFLYLSLTHTIYLNA